MRYAPERIPGNQIEDYSKVQREDHHRRRQSGSVGEYASGYIAVNCPLWAD